MRSNAFVITLLALVASPSAPAQSKIYEPIGLNDAVQPSAKIGPDDLLAVTVYDSPDLSRKLRVSSDGTIRLPLLSQPIRAAGLFPEQLEKSVADAFRNEKILVQPSVSVSILQFTSRPISVVGAVRRPITFDASGKVTLVSAITRAEGLTPEAGSEIVVSASDPQNGASVAKTIRVKELMDGNHPDLDVILRGGEEIRIPEAPKIFVMGNIKKPGAYSVQDKTDMTVLKVLALAGGTMPFSQKQAYIYHQAADGNRTEVGFDLKAMIDRKAPDIPMQANDMLYVVDNKGKRLTAAALDRIAGFGASTASGLVIFH
jgi:polysaccharide export outer membrane protein